MGSSEGAAKPGTGDQRVVAHVVAALGVALTVACSLQVLVGFVWLAHILSRTGRRERDLWWILVPGVNLWLIGSSAWRYTAPTVTWEPRPDRPSRVLSRRWLPGVMVLGPMLLAANVAIGLAEVRGVRHDGWLQSAARNGLVERLIDDEHVDASRASCVADHIEGLFASLEEYEHATAVRFQDALDEALARC